MKQEDKELLLKDLCARLLYRLIVNVIDNNDKTYSRDGTLLRITDTYSDCGGTPFLFKIDNQDCLVDITEIKPYLRPMSSMTEEENRHYLETCSGGNSDYPTVESFDYLKSIHIDYRGLIPLGLALEAPSGMYIIK